MSRAELLTNEQAPLPSLVSVPGRPAFDDRRWPLLCFLHGDDEGPPTSPRAGVTRHGPLAESAAPHATGSFLVVAPQLPRRGDRWRQHADHVQTLVMQAVRTHDADPERLYLTGFSHGANGVFDLALAQPHVWAALWPVDSTRVPAVDPGRPVWLSAGAVSRQQAGAFVERLALVPMHDIPGSRIYVDRGEGHVGTARRTYADERIYRWLLEQRLPTSPDSGTRA